MLSSKEANERKAGALICGQEKLTMAIPKLRNLLVDKEYVRTNHPQRWTRVYFVRKAAKEALEKLGEETGNVVVTSRE